MKKLLGALLVSPVALASCSSGSFTPGQKLGTVAKEAQVKIGAAKSVLHEQFLPSKYAVNASSSNNELSIETSAIGDVKPSSCSLTFESYGDKLEKITGTSRSQGKLIYQENSAFTTESIHLPEMILPDGGKLPAVTIPAGIHPATNQYLDLSNEGSVIQYTYLTQELYDSPVFNTKTRSDEHGNLFNVYPEAAIGKWVKQEFGMAEKQKATDLGINCGSFIDITEEFLINVEKYSKEAVIEMTKEDLDNSTWYRYSEAATGNMFDINFDKTTELPFEVHSKTLMDGKMHQFDVKVNNFDNTTITLPAPNTIYDLIFGN